MATKFALSFIVVFALLLSACTPKTTIHKVAIYTANAYTAFGALTDAVVRLEEAGKLNHATALKIHKLSQRAVISVDIVRNRAAAGGYKKEEVLAAINSGVEDVKALLLETAIIADANVRQRVNEFAFFLQFTMNSIQAVIAATKEPTVPEAEVKAAATGTNKALKIAQNETVWTDLVLILQKAVIATISQTRLTQADAFTEGEKLSVALRARLDTLLAQ